LVNELAAHPLCCERIGADINPSLFVVDAVGAFFVLLFLSADNDNVGLDLPCWSRSLLGSNATCR